MCIRDRFKSGRDAVVLGTIDFYASHFETDFLKEKHGVVHQLHVDVITSTDSLLAQIVFDVQETEE